MYDANRAVETSKSELGVTEFAWRSAGGHAAVGSGEKMTIHLTILSFACCNPKLAPYDQQYAERLKEALSRTGMDADIDLVHATEARMSPKYAFCGAIQPLVQKYGQGVTPALFINCSLTLFGGVPTVDKLVETLEKARTAVEQGRL